MNYEEKHCNLAHCDEKSQPANVYIPHKYYVYFKSVAGEVGGLYCDTVVTRLCGGEPLLMSSRCVWRTCSSFTARREDDEHGGDELGDDDCNDHHD